MKLHAAGALAGLTVAVSACLVSFEDYPVAEGGVAAAGAGGSAAGGGGTGGTAAAGGSSGSAGGGGSAGCECLDLAGWQGPVAFATSETSVPLPDCSGAYLSLQLTGFAGLSAPSSCEPCACDTTCDVTVRYHLSIGCPIVSATPQTFAFGTCTGALNGQAQGLDISSAPRCTKLSESVPTPYSWATHGRLCAGGSATPCADGGACAAAPPAGFSLCVYAPGEQQCPAGMSQRSVLYESATDLRACTPCSCSADLTSCSSLLGVFEDPQCTSSSTACPTTSACCEPGATFAALKTDTSNGGSCITSGGAFAGGAATADEPITICCQ